MCKLPKKALLIYYLTFKQEGEGGVGEERERCWSWSMEKPKIVAFHFGPQNLGLALKIDYTTFVSAWQTFYKT